MAEIRWSLTATQDVRDIEEFVARDSPVYAVRLTNRIVEAVERLTEFPQLGRVVPEFEQEDLREILYRSYRIVYRVQGEAVMVLRIVHGARGLMRLAEREPWDLID